MKQPIQLFLSLVISSLSFLATAQADPPAGLTAKWSGEGDATDSVGTNNGAGINLTFASGHSGQAFSFDGTSSVDFGSAVGNVGTNDFTMGFWIQTVVSNQAIFSYQPDCAPAGIYNCIVSEGRITFALTESPDLSSSVTSRGRIDDGLFHHVTVARWSADLWIYLDGVLSSIATAPGVANITNRTTVSYDPGGIFCEDPGSVICDDPEGLVNCVTNPPVNCVTNAEVYTTNTSSLIFGTNVCGHPALIGQLDEIEIYGRALTASEVYMMTHPGVTLAILTQPISQHALVERRVLFNVGAVGVDPITYQWRFNGLDIPGATDNSFIIESPQMSDAGTYRVIVSNPTGSLTSSNATLLVTGQASLFPNSLLARWSAEGTGIDSVGGYNANLSNVSFAPGVLGSAFRFSGSGIADCGPNVANFGTNDFTIDYWMQTKSTAYGMAVMSKRAICNECNMFDFRWSTPRNFLGFEFYQGNTQGFFASTHTSPSAIQLNDGVFHHIAEVRHDKQISMYVDGVKVDTAYSPAVIDLNNTTRFLIGTSPCVGVDGTGPFVGLLDEIEMYGRALSDVEIHYLYEPNPMLSIVAPPQGATVVEGENASFSVALTGYGPYSYQWRLNGANIPGATTSSYDLNNVQLSNAGTFSVVVHNSTDTITSAGAKLTVVPINSNLPGLINKWSAEGNAKDLVGPSELVSFNVHFAAGVLGQAFNFDGDREYLVLDSNSGNFGTNDFTIDFWMRNTGGLNWNQMIIGKERLYNVQLGGADGRLSFYLFDGQNSSFVTTPSSIISSNFHHIAVVRQSTNLKMYLDSSLVASTNTPDMGPISNSSYLQFGWFSGFAHATKDQLDEIEFYNRALTSSEIATIYARAANTPRANGQMQIVNASLESMESIKPFVISVLLGSTYTFSAPSIYMNPTMLDPYPISYQWQLNGIDIPGATNRFFTLAGVESANAGFYTVAISNPYGTICAPVVSLSIQLAPGSYNGLFYLSESPTDEDSGFVTLNLTGHQTYSGQLRQSGHAYPFTGQMSANNTTVVIIKRRNKTPLTLSMSACMEDKFDKLKGTVRNGSRMIPLLAHRAVFGDKVPTPQAGRYTLALPGGNSATAPNGVGFGNVNIKTNGSINFAANLADDTITSQGVYVAKSGVWPLYIPLYQGRGSILGWLSFTNSAETQCAGNLRWIKSSRAGGKYYRTGFGAKISVLGSSFSTQSNGLGIGLSNAALLLQSAKLAPQTERIVSTNENLITFEQSSSTNRVLTVSPTSGRFKGSFLDPVTQKLAPIKGIVLQNQSMGAGFFISTNLSGQVLLQQN